MMNSSDLAFTSALTQAELIRKGELTPVDLVDLYLERIQQLDPQLGSFVTVTAEQAWADAKTKTEQIVNRDQATPLPPFWGVPVAIKDLTAVQGVRCAFGSPALLDHVSTHDDAVVTRLKQAGFVILGKTSVSELGSLPYTEPTHLPTARNPWNLDYTPGGSSGGAAAAVAAGLCPVAQGSDGGGSVRGPAFCCGLVGMKPARGRISFAPLGDHQSGIASHGVLARTVTDAAALLDLMSGYVSGDPYWLPAPESSFLSVAQQGAKSIDSNNRRLRIAYATAVLPIGAAEANCQQAVLETASQLANLGHELEPNCPDFSGLVEPFIVLWRAGIATAGLPPEALSQFNQWLLSQQDLSGDYLKAVWAIQMIARRIVSFFEHYDALLLPTYLHPPIRIGEWAALSPADALERIIHWIAPCPPFNASGQPALALPRTLTPEGLPVGIQIIGRPADEATVIALAAQLEAAYPWQQRPNYGSL
jgi:amidase